MFAWQKFTWKYWWSPAKIISQRHKCLLVHRMKAWSGLQSHSKSPLCDETISFFLWMLICRSCSGLNIWIICQNKIEYSDGWITQMFALTLLRTCLPTSGDLKLKITRIKICLFILFFSYNYYYHHKLYLRRYFSVTNGFLGRRLRKKIL